MSYNPRRPKMVLADPTHPDYSRFTLRNGTTNPLTLQSFYNQPDLTDYVNSQKRMAGFYYQHPMKEMRKPEVYDEAPFGRSMDVDSRLEVKAYRGKYPSIAEKLQTITSFYPQFREEANNREFKEKINNKLKEIDDKLPLNLPRRKEVMEKLISKYIMNHFEDKLGLMSDRKILGGIERLTERNEVSDRLLEQLTMQLRGERTATATLGSEAPKIVPQSGVAVEVAQKQSEIDELKEKEEKVITLKDKITPTYEDLLNLLIITFNLSEDGVPFTTKQSESKSVGRDIADALKSPESEIYKKLSPYPNLFKMFKNLPESNLIGRAEAKTKIREAVAREQKRIRKTINDKERELSSMFPEAPVTPVAPVAPPVPRGETKSDETEGAEEREAEGLPLMAGAPALPLTVPAPPVRGRGRPKGK